MLGMLMEGLSGLPLKASSPEQGEEGWLSPRLRAALGLSVHSTSLCLWDPSLSFWGLHLTHTYLTCCFAGMFGSWRAVCAANVLCGQLLVIPGS